MSDHPSHIEISDETAGRAADIILSKPESEWTEVELCIISAGLLHL